jgi:hypothetical protein
MRLREVENHEQAVVKSDCCHYWIIDCSHDSVSEGHCKSCGEQRTFQNKVFPLSEGADGVAQSVEWDSLQCVVESDKWDSLRR